MSEPSQPLEVGQELFARSYPVDRATLVRYAGASGDFNPIHWNERVATEAGLPGVIVHGMATMGLAASAVAQWLGDPGAVLDYGVRFSRPIVVPDPGQVSIEVTGKVGAVEDDGAGDDRAGDHRTVRIDLTVAVDGVSVLARARAVVRLPRRTPVA